MRLGPFHVVVVNAKAMVVTLHTADPPAGASADARRAHQEGAEAWGRLATFWEAQGYSIRKAPLK